eukprot:CAMPEP_0113681606 /NCGR_PEP_ID=MMETSP0038_2-20120614/12112_1 /TAXON_ID=2898 /ORGANISM="Cryptomonas paramecium" /LENGTH=206 /DNA_ID=CAMNT_0000600405 /DNA_START=1483 /DNA_END=2099 /DNA_ORIENTATION=- /assembly_acc=CAM_ASM_000170
MVAEERFLKSYKIHALQAVGWEGVWGLALLCTGLAVVYQVPYGPDRCGGVGPWGGGAGARDCLENTWAAVGEIGGNGVLFAALVGNLVSISMFNFCGISVTKALSATHRTVLDSVRTMAIWGVSLALGWQTFEPLQVVGFATLLSGTLVYNELLTLPCLPRPAPAEEADKAWPAPESLSTPFLEEGRGPGGACCQGAAAAGAGRVV